jgi:hypothetical protein
MDKLPVVILRPSIGESPFCDLNYHIFFAGSHKKNASWESHSVSSIWIFHLKNNKFGRNKVKCVHSKFSIANFIFTISLESKN